PPATTARYAEVGEAVTEVFGSTETGGIAWRRAPRRAWTALRGVELSLDSESVAKVSERAVAPPRESSPSSSSERRGRLRVRSPWLVEPALAWTTSDRVELDEREPGHMRHLGRVDAVVKVGARRIDLAEIETWLESREGVSEARLWSVATEGLRGVELRAVFAGDADPQALRREMLEDFDA